MRRNILAIALLITFSLLGKASDIRELKSFNSISLWGDIKVELVKGDTEKAEIKVKGVDAEEVVTSVSGKNLKIKMKSAFYSDKEVFIKIYYTSLEKIECKAGGTINSNDLLEAERLELKSNSSGRIELKVKVYSIDAKCGQGGIINLEGETNSQEIHANTAGIYDALEMVSNNAIANANTGALVKVHVKKMVDATASSGATVSYMGNPEVESRKTHLGGEIIDMGKKETY